MKRVCPQQNVSIDCKGFFAANYRALINRIHFEIKPPSAPRRLVLVYSIYFTCIKIRMVPIFAQLGIRTPLAIRENAVYIKYALILARSTSFQEFQCGSPYDSPLNKGEFSHSTRTELHLRHVHHEMWKVNGTSTLNTKFCCRNASDCH